MNRIMVIVRVVIPLRVILLILLVPLATALVMLAAPAVVMLATPDNAMNNNNIPKWFLSIPVILVIVIAGWIWFFYSNTTTPARPATSTATLILHNQDYALAKVYQKAGKYDLAIQYYKKALSVIQDHQQIAQIRYNIATTEEKLGGYTDAIAGLKEIAADEATSALVRAYAVQEIGIMHYMYYSPKDKDVIIAETFKDLPYSSFVVDGDLRTSAGLNVAYTKLFEYASSIYPLAFSESRVAYGLALTMRDADIATTSPQGVIFLTSITKSLEATDLDILRLKNIPEEVPLISGILVREGLTTSYLESFGMADLNLAEAYFRKGLQYAAAIGEEPGSFDAYHYAAFLAKKYGQKRADDIKNILIPFRVGNDAQIKPEVADFFRTTRTDSSLLREMTSLVKMGRVDHDFKVYLISLGWVATDFDIQKK